VVLITGGSSGIGLGLAVEFLNAGSLVVICGRREDQLKAAQKKYPQIHYLVADLETPQERIKLFEQSTKQFPKLNIIVNNAGIQRRGFFLEDTDPWSAIQSEIDINLSAPIHLSRLFTPHLLKQSEAAIINVSSGLSYIPAVFAAVYSATKAGIHSYTAALRYNLHQTNIRVCELAPPAVKSNLGGSHDFGEECDEFCAAVFKQFNEGKLEFGYKFSDQARFADRQEQQNIMVSLASHFPADKLIPKKKA